jgi:hypothetical protein
MAWRHSHYQGTTLSYSDLLKGRAEVLSDRGIDGIIDLANLLGGKESALEKNADRFFGLTYPTADIRRVLSELDRRFTTDGSTAGLFLFEGLKGTGKLHLLLLVHHLFVNHDTATLWLSQHSLQCRLPTDATVVVNKFTDLPLISIWDFILEQLQLPKPSKPVVQPSLRDIEQALGGKRLVLILDELEQGIKVINDPIVRHQN